LLVLARLPSVESDLLSRSAKKIDLVDKGNQVVLSESITDRLSRSIPAITCSIITDRVDFTCLHSHLALFLLVSLMALLFANSQLL
jgi:hypothetical protein